MLFYLSNLLLMNRYEEIKKSLYLNYHAYQSAKRCFDANIYKLKALAFYKLNLDFDKVNKYLNDALDIFQSENIFHGIALISFIKAFLTYDKYKDS